MRRLTICLLLTLALCGCATLPFPKLPTPKKPDTVYNWVETERVSPKAVVTDGKTVVVEGRERTLQVGLEVAPKRLTFAERLGNWVSGLSMLSVIALLIGLFLAPSATIAFLLKVVKRWKRAMRQTVLAIKESGVLKEENGLHSALSNRHDEGTRQIVASIKAKG